MKLTKNQAAALADYPKARDWGDPPCLRGGLVRRSYACTQQWIFERVHDRTDNTVSVYAYRHRPRYEEWQPWNHIPAIGRRVGLIWRGNWRDEPEPIP